MKQGGYLIVDLSSYTIGYSVSPDYEDIVREQTVHGDFKSIVDSILETDKPIMLYPPKNSFDFDRAAFFIRPIKFGYSKTINFTYTIEQGYIIGIELKYDSLFLDQNPHP